MLNSVEQIKVVKIQKLANVQWLFCDINNYFYESEKNMKCKYGEIYQFSKQILSSTKHTLIFRTYILQFFKYLLAFTKHILIDLADDNCLLKQVFIFPDKYCLCYRPCKTCYQELSCY